jgi:hypothetical protein
VNNDGYDDLAVGIPGEEVQGIDDAGAVQIFYTLEDLERESMDEELILQTTDGVLPVVWLNMTYDSKAPVKERFDDLEQKYLLLLTGSIDEDFYR